MFNSGIALKLGQVYKNPRKGYLVYLGKYNGKPKCNYENYIKYRSISEGYLYLHIGKDLPQDIDSYVYNELTDKSHKPTYCYSEIPKSGRRYKLIEDYTVPCITENLMKSLRLFNLAYLCEK